MSETITDTSEMESLFSDISSKLTGHVKMYMIGGGAMMYMGRKAYTKDLDCVLLTASEYKDVHNAMKELGFDSIRPGSEYSRMTLSDMLEDKDGRRMDLFNTCVCGRLSLSENMASRAVSRFSFGNLEVSTCAPEDILIFKSITEREDDRRDCSRILAGTRVDWDAVLREIESQIDAGERLWVTWIAGGFEELVEEYHARIPIMPQLRRMAEDAYNDWVDSLPQDLVAQIDRELETNGDDPSK